MAAMMIQYTYRMHVAYEAWKHEELKQYYAKQRANVRVKMRMVSTIQRAYRRIMLKTFPEHARLASVRIVGKRRNKQYLTVMKIQNVARVFIARQRVVDERRRVQSANVIWWITKAYLLKLKLYDLVYETRIRKNNAANHIKRYFRRQVFIRWIDMKCSIRRAVAFTEKLREHAASFIQKRIFRKRWENRLPLRVAGRLQLKRKRQQEYVEWVWRMRDRHARTLQKFMVNIVRWEKFKRRVAKETRYFLEINSARRICIFGGTVVKSARYRDYMLRKRKHIADEEVQRAEMWAANRIGRNWKRKMQIRLLRERFVLRKKTLAVEADLREKRRIADEEREEAVAERIRTEETMAATIQASWKQGSDTNGRNYFYNYVTGESSWDPPKDWKSKVQDIWVRQVDQKLQVYYYNMKTQEVRWLPPCTICGKSAHRWCADCRVAYCEKDYKKLHEAEGVHPDMAEHMWSAAEVEKDILKVGQVYCIECKRRNGNRMCTTCWDPYCDVCFKAIHHKGSLRGHDYLPYQEAKRGWSIVKSRMPGEQDYYVHGTTGETTYDKPMELMTDSEKIFYENFQVHQAKAQEHVKKIEDLQVELESAKYERDTLMYDALQGGGGGGALGNIMKKKKKKGGAAPVAGSADIMAEMNKSKGFFGSLFGSTDTMYRAKIMNPSDRARGANRSEYIKGLIDNVGEVLKEQAKEAKK